MSLISIQNLCKNYEDVQAVRNLNLTVNKGEIFGFLGPNGAGKTTTINILTGLVKPISGKIKILDHDGIHNIKKVQEFIGIVPDESNLYDELSGFQNLVFCGALYGMPKSQRVPRARELLSQFNLDFASSRLFKTYSKGMKRKLTIAAALMHNPALLFLDEPTTGIDVESARQIRKNIKELNKAGTTIFLTTHYIEEAERLCDRIGFIVNGELIAVNSVANLMQEVQQEHIIEFRVDPIVSASISQFKVQFSDYQISIEKETDWWIIRITSLKDIRLQPFLSFFESHQLDISEARRIQPSLEEIFVRITGLALEKMRKEKERKK